MSNTDWKAEMDDYIAELEDSNSDIKAELAVAKDALRWHKYPEEKPQDGKFLFRYLNKKGKKMIEDIVVFQIEDGYIPFSDSCAIYWLPIPPLEEK